MDFAEFSDIETVGFATFKQKLQDQFEQDIEKEIIEAHLKNENSISNVAYIAKEFIPVISNVVNICNSFLDERRTNNNILPDSISKDILSRISEKFNQTMDQVGNYVNTIQVKFSEQVAVKQEIINSLTAELDKMKQAFLSEQMPVINKDLEIRRLRHKLTVLTTQNKILTHSVKDLKEKLHQRVLSEERAKKAKATGNSAEIDNLLKIIEQLNQRNIQLGDRLNEKEKKSKDNDIYTLTHSAVWISDKIAHALGLKDVATFVKNFVIVAEAVFRGAVILGYVYTLYNTTDHYLYWLKNGWKDKMSRLYALSILPFMLFCVVKLMNF